MILSDIFNVLEWWSRFLIIGIIFLPLTSVIFSNFFDRGYIFSKVFGILFINYAVFILGITKILPFNTLTIFLVMGFFALINILILKKHWKTTIEQLNNRAIAIFLFEELIFLGGLLFWSYIRAYAPNINGLEKFMDFGFVNSILRSDFFPPKDMWFTPFSINYYYFGHLITAVLTKLSAIPSNTTYNLMIATLFAFTFTCSFSIGANLINLIRSKRGVAGEGDPRRAPAGSLSTEDVGRGKSPTGPRAIAAGLLTAFLVSLSGNLHTIYTLFKPYENENPVPFWQLAFSPQTFPNSYWYPNATRFIHNTIHEFPIYSFVVSDLHGHVLSIPIVLTIIAVLLNLFLTKRFQTFFLLLIAFLLSTAYMTNAWDGIIYFLLTIIVLAYLFFKQRSSVSRFTFHVLLLFVGFFLFTLPFSLNFKPFVSGIGVLCMPKFFTDIGSFGPFLFEADHCQRSPLYQFLILYGFFYFFIISFFIWKFGHWKLFGNWKLEIGNLNESDKFIIVLIFLSTVLIIIPEFIYVKDIYPAHYRANTMFKLVYQSFMMLSLASGYIIVRIVSSIRKAIVTFYILLIAFLLSLVFIYPYFAVESFYGGLKGYKGLNGTEYLKELYPSDYEAILWLNKNIKGQPVILEAQGDSYTDYERVSANTGLPTVLGWLVHEWLWRGSYDIPKPRIEEVKTLYESDNLQKTKALIKKYNIELVFVGDLEREKYPQINEDKFKNLGRVIYQNGETKIYSINIAGL